MTNQPIDPTKNIDPTPYPAPQQQYPRHDERYQMAQQASPKPKKRRRIFVWFFLAIQALFIVWIIAGASSAGGTPDNCGSLDAQTCNDAEAVGASIGVFIIVIVWCLADFLLAVGYAIYRLARRP